MSESFHTLEAAADEAPLPTWRVGLAVATAALLPLSFDIGPWVHPKKSAVFLAPLDLLLVPLGLLLLLEVLRGRLKDWMPPWPHVLWALIAILSLAWSAPRSLTEWGRSAVLQTTLVGLVAVWVFRNLASTPAALRRMALALGASVGACVLLTLFQYVQPSGQPAPDASGGRNFGGGVTDVRVAGWYEYRGIFAAQAAMWIPAAAAFALYEKDAAVRAAAAALAVLAACVCMSGGGLLAAGVGVLAVAAAVLVLRDGAIRVSAAPILLMQEAPEKHGWWNAHSRACAAVAVLLAVVCLVLPRLPRKNDQVLWRTLTLFVPVEIERNGNKETLELPTARLRRYQAAINYLEQEHHWILGAGAGKYQTTIASYFDSRAYPKPGANTDNESAFDLSAHEKFSFGLLETVAVESGVLGLAALAWVFLAWMAAALSSFFKAASTDRLTRTLALASFGAAVGAAVFSVFGNPLLRGCGGTFAFFAGMACALHARAFLLKEPQGKP